MAATVPSRTPVTFPMVTSETAQAMMTQLISKPTLVVAEIPPGFRGDGGYQASPQFMATFCNNRGQYACSKCDDAEGASMPRDSA